MLLLSGQRGQTLHLLDIRNLSLSESQAVLGIGDLLKISRPGTHLSGLVFEVYPHHSCLCVVHTIKHYLHRTRPIRGELTGFCLTTHPPVWLASRDTLRRWVTDVMGAAGIDLTVFSPHSTRSSTYNSPTEFSLTSIRMTFNVVCNVMLCLKGCCTIKINEESYVNIWVIFHRCIRDYI
ncbi:hypothetical protein E2C01_050502 [Portunus trituberculatus]|uniref:Tyr recombinase domain-containing protein n=1 Tax=Portunus trituberculatus TaxID=210409 RepID=A0A5B7G8G0_PORTR|nr:hypothetical protein [Portunus trituberculatus]